MASDASEIRTQRYRTEDVQSDAGSFTDLLLPQPLVQALAAAGFVRPSPVQKAAIPIGRVGTDLIVQAKSGTGKTAVFATILLDRVDLEVTTPQAIVVAPTRELAIQSFQVIERIAAALPQPSPSAAVFVGGLPTADDEKRLRRVCHIAVGTPGRLCGLMTSGALLLAKIKAVVLDEADQLLGEGFYADTAWLLQQLPKRRQVLAFSATYTPELLADLEPLMRRPQKVLLCEETVSLLGIRQFYRLVGDVKPTLSTAAAALATSSSSSANGTSSTAAAAARGPAAAQDSTAPTAAGSLPLPSPLQASQPAAGDTPASAEATSSSSAANVLVPADIAATQQQRQQQQQQKQQNAQGAEAGESQEPQLSIAEQQQLLLLKVEALLQLLFSVSFHQAVVFCNRKPSAEWLARRLTAAGCPAAHLSSDLPQTERMAAMEAVRGFKVRVIVSTDVMARGVDFDRVNLVVNVDLPPDAATYVHRVGRTGRFGSRGVAVALVSQQELGKLQQYLAEVKGGAVSPLPEEIPADLYRFELTSDWEKAAYTQLLAAPTSTPPDSPPPLRKKKAQESQQEQQQQQGAGRGGSTGSAATAAALSAFGYDEAALACFDWEEEGTDNQQQQQAPQDDQQGPAEGTEAVAGPEGAYDPAAAWEAWASYYRSMGYEYPHNNPYLQHQQGKTDATAAAAAAAAAAPAVAQEQGVQQGISQPSGAKAGSTPAASSVSGAADRAAAAAAAGGADAEQWQAGVPQHKELCEGEEEDECEDEDEGWELPDEDEIDDRARLLLSRLHVTGQAEALAGPAAAAPGAAQTSTAKPAPAAGASVQSGPAACQHQQAGCPAAAAGASAGAQQQPVGAVCWECWAASYTAWQQQYTAWQQQYSAWCQHCQQQQWQQCQQYTDWVEAYKQLQSSQSWPS